MVTTLSSSRSSHFDRQLASTAPRSPRGGPEAEDYLFTAQTQVQHPQSTSSPSIKARTHALDTCSHVLKGATGRCTWGVGATALPSTRVLSNCHRRDTRMGGGGGRRG